MVCWRTDFHQFSEFFRKLFTELKINKNPRAYLLFHFLRPFRKRNNDESLPYHFDISFSASSYFYENQNVYPIYCFSEKLKLCDKCKVINLKLIFINELLKLYGCTYFLCGKCSHQQTFLLFNHKSTSKKTKVRLWKPTYD